MRCMIRGSIVKDLILIFMAAVTVLLASCSGYRGQGGAEGTTNTVSGMRGGRGESSPGSRTEFREEVPPDGEDRTNYYYFAPERPSGINRGALERPPYYTI